MRRTLILGPLSFLIPAVPSLVPGAELPKAANATALNVAGSWVDNAVPGPADVMLWNQLFTTPSNPRTVGALSPLGGNMSVQGIRVTNVGGTVNTNNLAIGFQNAGSAHTLTLGMAGIDLTNATQAYYLESRLALGADQTWVINNAHTGTSAAGFNNGEDLALRAMSGNTTTATVPFNLGGRTLTTSGNGAVTLSSGYSVTNGTMNLGNSLFLISGGDSRLVTVGPDVSVNVPAGSTLQYQSNSAGVTSAATHQLNGGTLKLVSNNGTNLVTLTGTTTVASASTLVAGNNVQNGSVLNNTGILFNANLGGTAPLTVTSNASTATRLHLGGDNSGYSGILTLGGTAGRIIRLTTANSGSAAATWQLNPGIVLETAGVGVALGTLQGAGTVSNAGPGSPAALEVGSGNFSGILADGAGQLALTKTGPSSLTLSGANTYSGETRVLQGTLTVTPDHLATSPVSVADGAAFGVNLAVAGTGINLPSLTMGSVSGASLLIQTGSTGNPAGDAPIRTGTLGINAPTVIRVSGSALATGSSIPLVAYSSLGGLGFPGISLALPPRTAGGLTNNTGSSVIELNIASIDTPRWRGNLSNAWDVNDGSGTGTLNWREVASGTATRYLQGAGGTDTVLFDDTASSGSVNLTTTLTPSGVTVDNSSLPYVFNGTGKLGGAAGLVKTGSGSLTMANTGGNDYSGTTTLQEGIVRIGDGQTPGAGSLGTGAITNHGTLVLDRPDDFGIAGSLGGTGTLTKNQTGTAVIAGPVTQENLSLQGGTLALGGGGLITGLVNGNGQLRVQGGTLQLAGQAANSFTGLTTVSGGVLQLNQSGGDALSGNLLFTGTGGLTLSQANQIADTATLTYDKAANGGNITLANETLAHITMLNGNDAGGQILANNGLVVSGILTVGGTAVFAVASNHSAEVGSLVLTGTTAFLRIAANSGPSTLNLAGDITASGGTLQVGQGVGEFDAVLNLGGHLTANGNLLINDGGYTGLSRREVTLNLPAHLFSIAAGTTTSVNAEFSGGGGFVKSGTGTLVLGTRSASTHRGDTLVNAGELRVAGSLSGTNLTLNSGTLSGNGSITTGSGGLVLKAGARLAPGLGGPGTLQVNVAGSTLQWTDAITPAASGALQFDLDTPAGSDRIALAGGALEIGSGVLGIDDFAFTLTPGVVPGTYVLVEGDTPVNGTLAANLTAALGGFTATLAKSPDNTSLVLTLAGNSALPGWRQTHFGNPANSGEGANHEDPDKDSLPNLVEFLFNTLPTDSGSSLPVLTGQEGANLTLEYSRSKAAVNDVNAVVEASTTLGTWSTTGVTEVTVSDNGITQVIKASVPRSTARFLRLKVTEK